MNGSYKYIRILFTRCKMTRVCFNHVTEFSLFHNYIFFIWKENTKFYILIEGTFNPWKVVVQNCFQEGNKTKRVGNKKYCCTTKCISQHLCFVLFLHILLQQTNHHPSWTRNRKWTGSKVHQRWYTLNICKLSNLWICVL